MRTEDVLRYFRLLPDDVQRRIANDELLPCVTAEMARRMTRPRSVPPLAKPKPRQARKTLRGRPRGSKSVKLTAEELDSIGMRVLSAMPSDTAFSAMKFAELVKEVDPRLTGDRYKRLVRHLKSAGLLSQQGRTNAAVYSVNNGQRVAKTVR